MADQAPPVIKLPLLPEFNESEVWLDVVHSLLTHSPNTTGLTQEQMFLCIFQKLSPVLQHEFRGLITDALDNNKYDTLVSKLRDRFAVPGFMKFSMIQPVGQLGTKKPSEFLRFTVTELKEIGITDASAVRQAFVKGLPDYLRDVAMAANYTIEELGHRLDEIVHSRSKGKAYSQANSVDIVPKESDSFEKLNVSINALNKNLSQLTVSNARAPPANKVHKSQSTSPIMKSRNINYPRQQWSPKPRPPTSNFRRKNDQGTPQGSRYFCLPLPTADKTYGFCKYHVRFGGRAFRCTGNCRWNTFTIRPHGCNPAHCKWTKFFSQTKNYDTDHGQGSHGRQRQM